MFRIGCFALVTLLNLLFGYGCNFHGPKFGMVGDTDQSFNTADAITTTFPDGWNSSDTATSHNNDSSPTFTDTVDPPRDASHTPELRPCTVYHECENATLNGTYECQNGVCVSQKLKCVAGDNEACSDHNFCTGIELCLVEGICALGIKPECDDQDPWTGDQCVPSHDACDHYPIYECILDEDCEDSDLKCSSELGGMCIPVDACYTDVDCDDNDACTLDRCLVGQCSNETYTCFDGDVHTLDVCYEDIGCTNASTCYADSHCNDNDGTTADLCIDGDCVHTREYIMLSILSLEYEDDDLRLYFGSTTPWIGSIPYQMYLAFDKVCQNGLLIDLIEPDGTCRNIEDDMVDVWMQETLLEYSIIDDDCGGRIFVPRESFDCLP